MRTINCYRQLLKQELIKRIEVNSKYSQRAFAKYLKMAPGELSEILNHKRNLSLKSAVKIIKALGLGQEESRVLINLLENDINTNIIKEDATERDKKLLSIEMFKIVSSWYCFAILNFSECDDFKWDEKYIAKRLGITTHEVKHAIQSMIMVGLIENSDDGYKVVSDFVFSPEGIPSDAIKKYHTKILDMAKTALYTKPLEEREFSSTGMAVSKDKIEDFKKDIIRFRNKMMQKYSEGKKDKVYQLQISFFELTQGDSHE
jgi:uncharacterized protein (TIGR02147 family)